LKYADALEIRLAVIIGPDEISLGTVTIKDLMRREQASVPKEMLTTEVKRRLVPSAGE
jgi:histidyl-tRNA synthetase